MSRCNGIHVLFHVFAYRSHTDHPDHHSNQDERQDCGGGIRVDESVDVVACRDEVGIELAHESLDSTQSSRIDQGNGTDKGQRGHIDEQLVQSSFHVEKGHDQPLAENVGGDKAHAQAQEHAVIFERGFAESGKQSPRAESSEQKKVPPGVPVRQSSQQDDEQGAAKGQERGACCRVDVFATQSGGHDHQERQRDHIDEIQPQHARQRFDEGDTLSVPKEVGDAGGTGVVVDHIQQVAGSLDGKYFAQVCGRIKASEEYHQTGSVDQVDHDTYTDHDGYEGQKARGLERFYSHAEVGGHSQPHQDARGDHPRDEFVPFFEDAHAVLTHSGMIHSGARIRGMSR